MAGLIEQRIAFADYLDRLASGHESDADWERYVVAHYADEFLEEMRRCIVRLRNYSNIRWGTTDAQSMIRHWASAVRFAANVDVCNDPASNVDIRVTIPECVVLDAILRRFSETDELSIKDAAEQRTLWNVQCVLEKLTARPDWPDVESASKALVDDPTTGEP
jgi:hypothetical protein